MMPVERRPLHRREGAATSTPAALPAADEDEGSVRRCRAPSCVRQHLRARLVALAASCAALLGVEHAGGSRVGGGGGGGAARHPWPPPLPPCEALEPLRLSNVFAGSGFVLQRGGGGARVWGFGAGGAACACAAGLVYGDGRVVAGRVTVDADGDTWTAQFPPLAASLEPATLVVLAGGARAAAPPRGVNASGVRVGDVHLCAGQSNNCCISASTLAAAASLEPVADEQPPPPLYGLLLGQRDAYADLAPLPEFGSGAERPWAHLGVASSAAAQAFGGVCWHMGRALARAEPGVPVGLVQVGWEGASIQGFSTPEALAACGLPAASISWVLPRAHTLYHAHVAPLARMALAGVALYLGETNAMAQQSERFECALTRLIADWRALFAAPRVWVGVVVLAPWMPDAPDVARHMAAVRDAQLRVALALPGVTSASGLDAGDPRGNPYGAIHPRRKRVIGERLAHGALVTRGARAPPSCGPVYLRARAADAPRARATDGDVDVAVVVDFAPETLGALGLELRPWDGASASARCPTDWTVAEHWCAWMEVRTGDGAWSNATTALTPDARALVLTVRRPASAPLAARTPTHTRNGWGAWPVVTLYSGGLPAAPWDRAVEGEVVT